MNIVASAAIISFSISESYSFLIYKDIEIGETYLKLGRLSHIMNHSIKTGFSFGLTSGIITTLGLMVGLHAGTNSKLAVLGGILTIAIADAFSDSLGIHISEESEGKHSKKEIWQSTAYTFLFKFVFSSVFIIPVLIFELSTAVIVSVVLGVVAIGFVSYRMAIERKEKPMWIIGEHLLITLVVVVLTHYVGQWIAMFFG